jgi:hypothetical protein
MTNTYTDLLKLRMPDLGDVGWDDEVNDNTMIAEFVFGSILKSNVIISGLAPSDGGGLDVDVTAGDVVVGGAEYSVGSGSKTCTSGLKNWLYVDDTGTLQITTMQPVGNYVAIALIDAGTSTIDRIADVRNFAEGALTIGVNYSPNYYAPDTGETGAINQHLAGIDDQLGIMAGFNNQIINGRFDIWQRSTSQTSNSYGSDDRWLNSHNGSTKTHSQQSFTVGQTVVPGNPKHYSRTEVSSVAGGGNFVIKLQKIEDVRTYAGQTCTLSFYASADAAKNIATEFYQGFGAGGSSEVNGIGSTTHNLTTTMQRFKTTVSIPSISGKTIGPNNDHFLGLIFWFDAGTDFDSRTNSLGQQSGTFNISNVQLERGPVATDFEERPEAIESLLCYRYYEQGIAYDRHFATAARYSGSSVNFRVRKRTGPTVTLANGFTADGWGTYNIDAWYANEDGFGFSVYGHTTTSTGLIRCTWTAEAEL